MKDKKTKPVVLLINDDPSESALLGALLEECGLAVRSRTGAVSALGELLPGAPPALIVTCLHLPDIDGWSFCRLLRSPEYSVFNSTPILIVSSGLSGDEPDQLGAALGADALVSLPPDRAKFKETVSGLLRSVESRPKRRALVALSDDETLSAVRTVFEKQQFEVTAVSSLSIALESFKTGAFETAIVEQSLPDGDGETLPAKLKKERSDCLCIMLIGDDAPPHLELKLINMGAAACLRKPVEAKELLQVNRRLRRERALLRLETTVKKQQREITESRKWFFELTNDLPALVCEFLPDSTLTFVNKAYCEHFGKAAKHLTGRPFLHLLPPEEARRIKNTYMSLTPENPVQVAVQFIIVDGEIRWHEWRNMAIFDRDGRLLKFRSVGVDITKRRMLEDSLRYSEERFRMLFNNINDAVFVADAVTGMIVDANKRALELIGYAPDELRKMHQSQIHPPEMEAEAKSIFAQALTCKGVRLDTFLLTSEGRRVPVEVSASGHFASGERMLHVGVFREQST